MLLEVVIVAIFGNHFRFFFCRITVIIIVLNSMMFAHVFFYDTTYFVLLLPYSSMFCVPGVTPNALSNFSAVALLVLLLRSRRNEPERAERATAKGRRSYQVNLIAVWF